MNERVSGAGEPTPSEEAPARCSRKAQGLINHLYVAAKEVAYSHGAGEEQEVASGHLRALESFIASLESECAGLRASLATAGQERDALSLDYARLVKDYESEVGALESRYSNDTALLRGIIAALESAALASLRAAPDTRDAERWRALAPYLRVAGNEMVVEIMFGSPDVATPDEFVAALIALNSPAQETPE